MTCDIVRTQCLYLNGKEDGCKGCPIKKAYYKGVRDTKKERPQGDFTRNELESWLYRIASNNLNNELGRSCEEIICRLNGFERFVSDMRKGR